MRRIKKLKDLKKFTLQLKDNHGSQTRNNESEEQLSTINPNNPGKNVLEDDEITIKFTEDRREDFNDIPMLRPENSAPKITPGHFKTRSQNIKTVKDLERIARKPPKVQTKPSFEDDMDPITLNEYMSNAKMAKEQKHKLTQVNSRSNSKKRLVNFFRPASSKETPNHRNRIEMRVSLEHFENI